MRRVAMLPYTFVLMNWAAVESLYRFLRFRRDAHKAVWSNHATHSRCHHRVR